MGQAENFIEKVAGCGPFQIVFLLVTYTANISTGAYVILFMSFGNYNPGWRCLDNTTSPNISITTVDPGDVDYTTGSCDEYNQCRRVEFNPETSTIVTEWGLLCDKAWMSSMTISIQMAGMLISSFVSGQLADIFGRKKILYGGIVLCGIVQLASAFSISWGMFVIFLSFECGLTLSNLLLSLIYVSEFLTAKWRAIIISLPFWYIGATILGVTAMITKDWRQMQMIGVCLHVVCFVPVFWVPESLRWLEVKRISHNFNLVVRKVAHWNKSSDYPTLENENVNGFVYETTRDNVKKYTIIDIFRHGYAFISICLGSLTLMFSLVFYSLIFGTKSLYGGFYINLIIVNVIPIPVCLVCLLGVNYLSRKCVTFIMLITAAVCVFMATGMIFSSSEAVKSIGSTVTISVARGTLDIAWLCTYTRTAEIYPTVVRGTGLGFVSVTARIGGIIAPFIIPEDQDHLYIFTTITGALIVVTCILSFAIPETKGKPLKEDFEDRVYENQLEQPVNENIPI